MSPTSVQDTIEPQNRAVISITRSVDLGSFGSKKECPTQEIGVSQSITGITEIVNC